jgi:hypothetical protein
VVVQDLHRANEPGNVLLEVGEGSLPEQSVVVVSQISSVMDPDKNNAREVLDRWQAEKASA